jgi:holo-[acyl-carrier protein] synthase
MASKTKASTQSQSQSQNLAVGIDLEDVKRFSKLYDERDRDSSKNFLSKVYTKKELEYCFLKPKPSQHLAARFCAKEAIIKAFLSKGKKITYTDIEVLNDSKGMPSARLLGKGFAKVKILLSLSHTGEEAAAFVICIF